MPLKNKSKGQVKKKSKNDPVINVHDYGSVGSQVDTPKSNFD